MARGVDLLGLFDGSVVKPQNDIAIVPIVFKVGPSDGHWFIRIVSKDCQGAGGIKANSTDGCGIDVVLVKCSVDTVADTAPNVSCGLLVVSGLWLP